MKYLDQVVSETLRMWPAAPMADRQCTKDYEVQYDGRKFMIEAGRTFYIPIHGLHQDEKYFKNPKKFDPERFSDENKADIDPDTYLPFGGSKFIGFVDN
jgi:cytochrome P450 family 9